MNLPWHWRRYGHLIPRQHLWERELRQHYLWWSWTVSSSRRQGECSSWKMVIRPHGLFGVVGAHMLFESTELGVCQRCKRESGTAAWSWGFSCLCYHVVLLSPQAEQSVAELTGSRNTLSAEIADLRVATAKMSSINEALASDKVQLNKLLLQVSRAAKAVARCSSPADASQTSCF